MERILMPIREAAEILGLGRTTIYRLMNDGDLESVKIGRRRLIKVASVHQLVEQGARPTIRS